MRDHGTSGLDVSGLIIPDNVGYHQTGPVHVHTTPDTFGANIGRAQEEAGAKIGNALNGIAGAFIGMAKEQMAAENDTALTDLQDSLQQKFTDWQQNNQGFNATSSLGGFKQAIDDDIGQRGGGGFFGGSSQYDKQAAKLRSHYLQSATAYAAKQHDVAADASYLGYLTKTGESAVLNRDNDKAVADNLDAISERASQYYGQKGLDADAVGEMAKAARGPAVTSLFNAYVSDGQFDKALTLYNGNKDKVDAKSLDHLNRAMSGLQDDAIAAQTLRQYGPQGEHAAGYSGPTPQAPAGVDVGSSLPAMTYKPPENAAAHLGMAQNMLRKFESFSPTAYWDVNHWRVGFGSDTITHADGRIETVTAFTKVTREDAERDLARRSAQYQAAIQKTIGPGAWNGLSDGQKAALTSVAYNYGHLPNSVAEAAASGGDIGQAIAGLRGHNGGVNAKRRMQEAAIANGGAAPAGHIPAAQYAYDTQGAARAVLANENIPLERRLAVAQKIQHFGSLMQKTDDEAALAVYADYRKNPDQWTIDRVMDTPGLQPNTKKQMIDQIAQDTLRSDKDDRTYGSGFNDILQRMDKPASEGGVESVQQLFAAKNNGLLTTAGLDKSISYYNQLHRGEAAENRDDWQLFAQEMARIKQNIVHEKDFGNFHQRDPEGEKLYNQIYRNVHDQFDALLKGKDNSRDNSRKFLDDLDGNVMGMYRKMRSPAQELAMKIAQNRGLAESAEGEQKQIAAAPLGVDKEKWGDLMRAPPMNPKDSKPFPQDRWAQGVKALLSYKDVPAARKAFDAGPFGREYKADDIIKMLTPEQEAAAGQSAGSQSDSLVADAVKQYPFLEQYNPVVKVSPREDVGFAETFAPGEEGAGAFIRPKEFPMDKTGVEIYRPGKFNADDLAAEFLHVDPKAQEARAALLPTLSEQQIKILKNQPDYENVGGHLSDEKRLANVVDSMMRGYTVGQWPKQAIDELQLSDKQRAILDGLKNYMTGKGETKEATK